MNKFDILFFQKYVPEGQEVIDIVHIHMIEIFKKIFLIFGLFVAIPTIFYYQSNTIQDLIPFYVYEVCMIIGYVKIIYDIFDWYNDVWIITNEGIVAVERSLLKINSDTLRFEHIEGVGVEKNSVFDVFLKKGDLVVHKFGDEAFILENANNPYRAVDLIESDDSDIPNTNITEDRFNKMLETLSSSMGNDEKIPEKKENSEKEKEKYIKKISRSKGVLDLRD